MSITMSLLTFGLFTACGDKEEDTATTTDTATTEETDTEETDTEETDTEDPITDADGDGFEGDDDCNDDNAAVNPDAEDVVGDGVDNNCDGIDGLDTDGDGYAAIASGGDDCADDNPDRNPGAAEIEGDYVDQDCSFLQLNLDTTCSDATEVRLTGPWWGWDAAAGPEGVKIADGHFQFTFDPAPGENMEFIFHVIQN